MKETLSSRLHLATWCVACLLTLFQALSGKPAEQITGTIIATLFWMAVYYLFFLVVAPRFLIQRRLIAFFGLSALIAFLLPALGYTLLFLSRSLFRGNFADYYAGYTLATHFSGFKAMALAGVYGSFFRLITEFFR